MPKVKTTYPEPTREKGQRSLDLPEIYINRILPQYSQPQWMEADFWRRAVAGQPFATVCRDILLDKVLALDWKIEPRDGTKRDEYKSEIEYYTKFFENTGEIEYPELIEWIGKDALDIPFGGAAEVGRENDSPDGKVIWIDPLDGGTLFPTFNSDFPVGQSLKELPSKTVYFPYYAINRLYSSPRTDIRRKGWGMAPPEKIYLSLVSLSRGDVYYANLLLDTPEVGILDLGDMAKDSAELWVESWRGLLNGIDPFKIPVLYEHEKPAQFIQFGRSPTEMMFDKALMKYAGICAAGYGMTISDLGFSATSSGGETLAGGIRQERNTRKTGVAVLKKKFTAFFNRLLPEYLKFAFIDLDDELSVALGRARLANATAWQIMVDKGIFTPNEARTQTIADGLVTVSIPEKIEGGDEVRQPIPAFGQQPQERPGMLGKPVSPSQGGYGEVKSELSEAAGIDLSEFIHIPLFQEDSDVVEGVVTMSDNGGEMDIFKAFMMIGKAIMDFSKRPINIYIPRSEVPVSVHMPQQSAPTPIVNVSVPEQKQEPPTVVVNVPEQKPPVVNIKSRRKAIGKQKVKRDENGNLLETITETEYTYDGE